MRTRFKDDALFLRAAAVLIILIFTFPGQDRVLASTSSIGVEIAVSSPRIGASNGRQGRSSTATDGDAFYVVWLRNRSVILSRVTAAGELLDPEGKHVLEIGGTFVSLPRPVIAWNGSQFLLVWSDGTSIFSSLMSTAGELTTPAGTLLAPAARPWSLTAAYGGTRFLIAWETLDFFNGRSAVSITLTDASGQPVRSPILVSSDAGEPRVASNGRNFLVGWVSFGQPFAAQFTMVDMEGSPGPIAEIGRDFNRYSFDVTVFGERYGIGYARGAMLLFQIVRSDGTIEGVSRLIADASPQDEIRHPAIEWSGSMFAVVYESLVTHPIPEDFPDSTLYMVRVNPEGEAIDRPPLRIATTLSINDYAGIAWNGRTYYVSWNHSTPTWNVELGVRGSIVEATGAVLQTEGLLTGLALSRGANQELFPVLRFAGLEHLVVWTEVVRNLLTSTLMEPHKSVRELTARAVTPFGVVEGAPVESGVRAASIDFFIDSLAFDGATYLGVTMGSLGEVVGFRFNRTGEIIGRFSLFTGSQLHEPRPLVAFANDHYLIVHGKRAFRVSPFGMVLEPGVFALSSDATPSHTPLLASNGRSFLVIWSQSATTLCRSCAGTFSVVVDPTGKVSNERRISSRTIYEADLASNAHGYLLVWSDSSAPLFLFERDLKGISIDSEGRSLSGNEGFVVINKQGAQENPRLAWNGRQYGLIWQESQSDGSSKGVYLAYLSATGSLLAGSSQTAGLVVSSTGSSSTIAPAINGFAVAYTRPEPASPFYGLARTFVRFIGPSNEPSTGRRRATRR